MITITIHFKSCGKTIKKVAVLSNDLSEISKCKKNEADTLLQYTDFNIWTITFYSAESEFYEVEFRIEDESRTLKPIDAITWTNEGDGAIIDVQKIDKMIIK